MINHMKKFTNETLSELLNTFLDNTMEQYDLPGLAIGISIGGIADGEAPCQFTGVRGYRNKETEVSLEPEDIFHCASVSKLFTSSAILKLIEGGALNLEDRLADLLPDLEIDDKRFLNIRLWNLLTHTSGLGDCDDYHWDTPEFDEDALKRYVYSDEVRLQPMRWEPQADPESPANNDRSDSKFSYSNPAYEILGHIVSEYSAAFSDEHSAVKLSFEDFVARYLMEPAGMSCSSMKTYEREGWASLSSEMPETMVFPHEKGDDRSINLVTYYPYTRQHAPSSTLTSNPGDLLKWGRANIKSSRNAADAILSPDTYKQAWHEYATVPNNGEKIGLGWFMRKQKIETDDTKHEFTLLGHEGTDDGFRSSFWICPELDLVITVLCNLTGAPTKRICRHLLTGLF